MKKRKGHQISERGTVELQKDKTTSGYCHPNIFLAFQTKYFFCNFLKEGMCPNIGRINCSD